MCGSVARENRPESSSVGPLRQRLSSNYPPRFLNTVFDGKALVVGLGLSSTLNINQSLSTMWRTRDL
jgi:hypothetical protein